MHLADVNIWLALAFEAHAHHRRALRWFDTVGPDACAMCRLVQNGFLRLATNPAVFGEETVTMVQAWALYDELVVDERVCFLPEPHGLEPVWRSYTEGSVYSPKVWSDAYLAAFANAGGMGVASLDEGFREYEGLELTVPE